MAYTHYLTVNFGSLSPLGSPVVSGTANQEADISITIAAATTNQQIPLNLGTTLADVKSIFITTDKALTIKTNTTTGVDNWSIPAGGVIAWCSSFATTIPLTAAITNGLYVTNAAATTCALTAHFLYG